MPATGEETQVCRMGMGGLGPEEAEKPQGREGWQLSCDGHLRLLFHEGCESGDYRKAFPH